MGAGTELKYPKRKRERLRSTDLGAGTWTAPDSFIIHHGFLLVWSFSPIVIVPSQAKPFFPVVCGAEPSHAYYGQGGEKATLPSLQVTQTSPSQKVFLPQFILKSTPDTSTLSLHPPHLPQVKQVNNFIIVPCPALFHLS
jgi:hypothetical protein